MKSTVHHPPKAPRVRSKIEYHGYTLSDYYSWMREKKSRNIKKYLRAENDYTRKMMAPSNGLQKKLYSEILSRIKESDMEVPYLRGKYMYYSRTEKGKQYRLYCRKLNINLAREEIILDSNALAFGKKFLSLGFMDVSPDSRFLAYATDTAGFREYTLFFKNLLTGKNFIEKIQGVRSFAWSADNKTFFYVTEDQAKRAYKVWTRVLGDRNSEKLIYEEKNKSFSVYVELSRSHEYIFITSSSSSSSEVRFLRAKNPNAKYRLFRPRKKNIKYYVDHGKDYFYVLTNDKGKNFRLIKTSTTSEKKDSWQVVPHRKNVMLDNIEVFADFIVLHERKNGFPRLCLLDLGTGNAREIHLDEIARTVGAGKNFNFTTDCYRYEYESYVTPDTTFEYCLGKSESTILKRRTVGSDYDPKQYTVDVIKAKAKDGTLIPISMVYRSDLKQTSPQDFLLTGYGAYGYPNDAYFSVPRLSLLDRGLIVGTAHVRGGGEFGKKWHEQGSLLKKENSFTDFIACADALFAADITEPNKLIIEGGSAGGLLIGAVVNRRPDLCRGAVLQVPFVDMMNTMLDPSLPLTIGEYEEWGNPNQHKFFKKMLSYSPYDNLKESNYPAMLVETSINDSQVMFWEPAKYVAKIRTLKKDTDKPLLFKINMNAGHGGSSGRYDAFKEIAFTTSFILGVLGITK